MASHTVPYLSTTPRAPLRSAVRKLWASAWAMRETRAARQQLAEMEPRMLSDIGVSRSHAQHEASRMFWDLDTHR